MRTILLFSLILFALQSLSAQSTTTKNVDSKIEKVIVFLNGAQIIRSAKATLNAGKTELVFQGISPNVNKQSIQVKAEGKLTIMSVVHQSNFLVEQNKRAEIEKIITQKDAVFEKIGVEKSYADVYKQEEAMLLKNQEIAGQNNGLKVMDLKEAIDFQRNRLTEVKLKQLEIEKNLIKLNQEIQKLDNQLKALNQRQDLSTSEILVTVSTKELVNASFTLTYLVNNARWFPTYDVRVKDVASPIDLFFKANILQNCGEDWKDVKLTLSTGNPDESGQKPSLKAWYLTYNYPNYSLDRVLGGRAAGVSISANNSNEITGKIVDGTGVGLPGVSIFIKGTSIGTITDTNGNFSIQKPQGNTVLVVQSVGYSGKEVELNSGGNVNITMEEDIATLSEVVVTGYATNERNGYAWNSPKKEKTKMPKESTVVESKATENQISIDFEIELPYTIPSDGKVYTVDIKEHNIPAIYEYYCAPKLDLDVFLTAKIVDWEEYNLLAGEANLFFEGTFLGKSLLDVRNVSDTLEISLGRDKNVTVTRTKIKDFSKKSFLGATKTETRNWEINIRNKKSQAVDLILEDQFPISNMKEVEVERIDYQGATLEESTGKLTWKLKIKPTENIKIGFKYLVKYPKNQNILIE